MLHRLFFLTWVDHGCTTQSCVKKTPTNSFRWVGNRRRRLPHPCPHLPLPPQGGPTRYPPAPSGMPTNWAERPLLYEDNYITHAPATNGKPTNEGERPQRGIVPGSPAPIEGFTTGSWGKRVELDGVEVDTEWTVESTGRSKRVGSGGEGEKGHPSLVSGRDATTRDAGTRPRTLRDDIEQALFGVSSFLSRGFLAGSAYPARALCVGVIRLFGTGFSAVRDENIFVLFFSSNASSGGLVGVKRNPLNTAVPFRGQTTKTQNGLSPKREWSPRTRG